jgi:hypothetical protein
MAITVAAVDGIRGMEKSSATQRLFYRSLGLSEPALTSAGRRPPNHALRSSTIDWRYQPLLPQQDPALIRLLATESLAGTKAPLP